MDPKRGPPPDGPTPAPRSAPSTPDGHDLDDRSHALNHANAVAFEAAYDECRRDPLTSSLLGGFVLAIRAGGGLGAGTIVMSTRAFRDPVDHTGGARGNGPRSPLPRSRFLRAYLLEGNGGVAGELGHWQVSDADLREVLIGNYTGLTPFAPGDARAGGRGAWTCCERHGGD